MSVLRAVAGWGVAGIVAALFAGVAAPALADRGDEVREVVRQFWKERLLAPSASSDPAATEAVVRLPDQHQQVVLSEIEAWGRHAKTAATDNQDKRKTNWWQINYLQIAPDIGMGTLQAKGPGTGAGDREWPFLSEKGLGDDASSAIFSELSGWMVEAVDREVRKLSLAATRRQETSTPGRLEPGRWTTWDGMGNAFAWAGPAVKDGAASYRPKNDGMAVRISMPSELAAEIYRLALHQGFHLQLQLKRGEFPLYSHTPVIITGSTDIPVWLVSAELLIPARLTAFSTGGQACDGSQWMEFSYKGTESPPVWAVLTFTDPSLASGMTARRLPGRQPSSYQEVQRSEIELRWPNDRLPPVRVVAKRFEWVARQHERLPDGNYKEISKQVVGSAWGTQVLIKTPKEIERNYSNPELLLSSAGTPACPPP